MATVICPLVMNYLLLKKTGKPLLEAHLSTTRPGYADVHRTDQRFLPVATEQGATNERCVTDLDSNVDISANSCTASEQGCANFDYCS